MYLKILACDLDGTLAQHGEIAPATWRALRDARQAGVTLVLVTGRRLETFAAEGPYAEMFEAIVAEDGAAVYFPRNDSVVLPFGRLAPEIGERLQARGIPLEKGMALVATWMPHIETVDEVLRETGRGATVEFNKGAVMVLPPGATKGTGLRFALHEMGYSPHNVVACGDAENDRSLFEVAEFSAAVANATPEISELADWVLPHANGAGVRHLLHALTSHTLPPCRNHPDRLMLLGHTMEEAPVHLHPRTLLDGNLCVVGDSTSGKSWLAGLLAEELLKLNYQICIIDPEGDYSGLRAFPHTLVLGSDRSFLPPVIDVVTLCEYSGTSLILDLSAYKVEERAAYVLELFQALRYLKAQRGRPHWFLIDEVHSFCSPEGGALTDLLAEGMTEGGYALVSFRPSLVAPALLSKLNHWLVTRMTWNEEVAALERQLAQRTYGGLEAKTLHNLPLGDAVLCLENAEVVPSGLVRFRTVRRDIPHVRHLHKYLRVPLPEPKRFYFRQSGSSGPYTAANLWEFRDALQTIPPRTLDYHLRRGDFERWLREVLHDEELARRIRKIKNRNLEPDRLRVVLARIVSDRYEELESMI